MLKNVQILLEFSHGGGGTTVYVLCSSALYYFAFERLARI